MPKSSSKQRMRIDLVLVCEAESSGEPVPWSFDFLKRLVARFADTEVVLLKLSLPVAGTSKVPGGYIDRWWIVRT